uniref:Uncharacterized protein n=1 Tax=Romanomermis culicivorax TaxID=13658 RepID=A0A915JHE3_ROMCU
PILPDKGDQQLCQKYFVEEGLKSGKGEDSASILAENDINENLDKFSMVYSEENNEDDNMEIDMPATSLATTFADPFIHYTEENEMRIDLDFRKTRHLLDNGNTTPLFFSYKLFSTNVE